MQETTCASKCAGPQSEETDSMGLDKLKDWGCEEADPGVTWTSLLNLALELGEMGAQVARLPADTSVFQFLGHATRSRDECRICCQGCHANIVDCKLQA